MQIRSYTLHYVHPDPKCSLAIRYDDDDDDDDDAFLRSRWKVIIDLSYDCYGYIYIARLAIFTHGFVLSEIKLDHMIRRHD